MKKIIFIVLFGFVLSGCDSNPNITPLEDKPQKGRFEVKVIDYLKYVPSSTEGNVMQRIENGTLIKIDTATGRVWKWIDEQSPSKKEHGKTTYFYKWDELVDARYEL